MSNQVGRLHVLIGLPGSGKSTLLKTCSRGEDPELLIVDDYQAHAIANQPDPQWSRNRELVTAALRAGRSVVISDISYCRPTALARLIELMQKDVPGVHVEVAYFENDPVSAAHNVRLRAREQAEQEVELIEQLSKTYDPPHGAMTITRGPIRDGHDDTDGQDA